MAIKSNYVERENGVPATQLDLLLAVACGNVHKLEYGAKARAVSVRLPVTVAGDIETLRRCNGGNLSMNTVVGEVVKLGLQHFDEALHSKGNEELQKHWEECRKGAWQAVLYDPEVSQ